MPASLFWYDIETFGRNPQLDRIAQFAGIRTNDRFEPVGDAILEYVRISSDYVPDPQACFVTGITPQETLEKGKPEYELAEQIFGEWMQPGTCVVGYNNIRFDDEFMRNLFYRNLFDPYLREYANKNSRWDLIDVMRAAHDLRPEGIKWPRREDGRPSFRLEELCALNGIEHSRAHDALSDVEATIGLAKLLHERQPKLFRFMYNHRTKKELSKLINLQTREPVLFTSVIFTRQEGCTSVVSPIAVDPANRNSIIAFDLRGDPALLSALSVEEMQARVFTSKEEREGDRIPLISIPLNKSPVLAPLKTLDKKAADRLGLDRDEIDRHWKVLKTTPDLTEKVRAVFEREEGREPEDVDLGIYSGGFFMDEDRELFERFHREGAEGWRDFLGKFSDPRADKLLNRLIGRNYPHLFSEGELKRWKNFCATRLLFPPEGQIDDFGTHEKKLLKLSRNTELGPGEKLIVRELLDYAREVKNTVLAYR
jgi:exodeoxyribonuclease-1